MPRTSQKLEVAVDIDGESCWQKLCRIFTPICDAGDFGGGSQCVYCEREHLCIDVGYVSPIGAIVLSVSIRFNGITS